MIIDEFYEIVVGQIKDQFEEEKERVLEAAKYCANSVVADRLIHIFGCGHSQMFAMEAFYRAGGLVPVNALLIPHLALHPRAKLSTIQERVEGFSQEYLELQDTSDKDTMIIVSISGRNAGVVDMALAAKEKGMKVVALTSKKFSSEVTSRHSSNKNLYEVADVVIDIKCVKGDAALSLEGLETPFIGTSTILGMFVIQSIMASTIEMCVKKGMKPPIYVSSNLDQGDEINKEYIKKYKGIIENL